MKRLMSFLSGRPILPNLVGLERSPDAGFEWGLLHRLREAGL